MDDRGTLLDGAVRPGAEGAVRGLDGAVDGSRVEAVELQHDLPGVGDSLSRSDGSSLSPRTGQ
jgi:hypothetical protein